MESFGGFVGETKLTIKRSVPFYLLLTNCVVRLDLVRLITTYIKTRVHSSSLLFADLLKEQRSDSEMTQGIPSYLPLATLKEMCLTPKQK